MAIQNPDKFRIAIATAQKEENNMTNKGSFTIIDIYESVHSVRFLMTVL